MVTQQILVLSFQVRVLAVQRSRTWKGAAFLFPKSLRRGNLLSVCCGNRRFRPFSSGVFRTADGPPSAAGAVRAAGCSPPESFPGVVLRRCRKTGGGRAGIRGLRFCTLRVPRSIVFGAAASRVVVEPPGAQLHRIRIFAVFPIGRPSSRSVCRLFCRVRLKHLCFSSVPDIEERCRQRAGTVGAFRCRRTAVSRGCGVHSRDGSVIRSFYGAKRGLRSTAGRWLR